MFSTPKSLAKRTGKSDVDRPTYIKQLLEEYEQVADNAERRLQILGNLGNFAYDPINYEYFRRFNALDIFLNVLRSFQNESTLSTSALSEINFSLAAICNLCLDLKNKDYLLRNNLLNLVIHYLIKLKGVHELVVLNALMTLIFLFDETNKLEILNEQLVSNVSELCKSNNKQIANLASLFIQDYYLPQINKQS